MHFFGIGRKKKDEKEQPAQLTQPAEPAQPAGPTDTEADPQKIVDDLISLFTIRNIKAVVNPTVIHNCLRDITEKYPSVVWKKDTLMKGNPNYIPRGAVQNELIAWQRLFDEVTSVKQQLDDMLPRLGKL